MIYDVWIEEQWIFKKSIFYKFWLQSMWKVSKCSFLVYRVYSWQEIITHLSD